MTMNSNANIYGYDLWAQTDMDPGALEVGGTLILPLALYRRTITPQGSLIYDLNYGYDLNQFVNSDFSNAPGSQSGGLAGQIAGGVDAEYRKDQRVYSSTTTPTIVETNGIISLQLASVVVPSQGPTFQLVLGVGGVYTNPTILNVNYSAVLLT